MGREMGGLGGGLGRGRGGRLGMGRGGPGMSQQQNQGLPDLVKRVLKKDVLYLMIANMPTEEEIQVARAAMAAR